jgi:uncharacterized GH25 family protein
MKKIKILMTMMTAMLFLGSTAFAHNLWINPSDHYPKVGDTVDIAIAWGHTYKAGRVDQEMKAGNLAYIKIQGPDGKDVKPVTVSETLYKLKIDKAGAYLVTAGIKPGVFTKTPEGRKWSDKRGVENAISCTSFSIEAKSLVLAGGKDKNLGGNTGQELEVIPLSSPINVKAGGEFDVQVLFKDKPAENVTVNAAYAGFADEGKPMDAAPHNPGGEAAKDGKEHQGPKFPATSVTDKSGKASLALTKKGYWMVSISHKTPYPDKTVCDEYMDNMAFTFEIK